MTTGDRLTVRGLDAWYGPMRALFDVSLRVGQGERVALLGRNGAGKTTTFLALMGVQVRTAGEIAYGDRTRRIRTVDLTRHGIAWVPDTRRVFRSLSVRDNLAVAAPKGRLDNAVRDEILGVFPPLAKLLDRKGGELSGGEQQMLAIGRALVSRPSLLLLDEPTEGLAPVMAEQLQRSLAQLSERGGLAILLAEQNLSFALNFCERAYVLDVGRVVFDGPTEDVRESLTGWQHYLVGDGPVPVQ